MFITLKRADRFGGEFELSTDPVKVLKVPSNDGGVTHVETGDSQTGNESAEDEKKWRKDRLGSLAIQYVWNDSVVVVLLGESNEKDKFKCYTIE